MDTSDPHQLYSTFPKLRGATFEVRSPKTPDYNCIAFAANDTTKLWWPGTPDAFWPEQASEDETVEAFTGMFGAKGYSECETRDLEAGFEKVAIFKKGGEVTHAARQLPDGRWISKIGTNVDIANELSDLESDLYGEVAVCLHRPVNQDREESEQ